MEGNVYLLTT